MRSLTFLSTVFCFVSATFLLHEPSDLRLAYSDLAAYFPPSQDAIGDCLSIPFLHCQYTFNSQLGINTDLTWRNASSILYALRRLMATDDFGQGPLTVCNARQQFAQCLGVSYPGCINRFTLLNLGNTDFLNVITYVHMFKHLEYVCNGGFEIVSNNWLCINRAEGQPDAQNCQVAFNTSVNADPREYCRYAQTLGQCVQQFYGAACSSLVGWSACEDERVGFADECFNFQCTV